MNLCILCGAAIAAAARFCQNCGRTLGATTLNGKTLVQPVTVAAVTSPMGVPVPASPPPRSTTSASGAASPHFAPQPPMDQRELTFFINDISSSMQDPYDDQFTKLDAAKRAAITMVINKAAIDPADEIGIITFNSTAVVRCQLMPAGPNKRFIIDALQSLAASNGTDINEGLRMADWAFDWQRGGVVRRIVLLTDGKGGYPLSTAEQLKLRGVVIDVIGVGKDPSGVDEKLLKRVASVVDGELRYRFIKDQQSLVNHYTHLAQKTRIGA